MSKETTHRLIYLSNYLQQNTAYKLEQIICNATGLKSWHVMAKKEVKT